MSLAANNEAAPQARTVPGEPGRDRIKPARRYARWLTNLSESCHRGLSL